MIFRPEASGKVLPLASFLFVVLASDFCNFGLQGGDRRAFYRRSGQWRMWFGRCAPWYWRAWPPETSLLQFSKDTVAGNKEYVEQSSAVMPKVRWVMGRGQGVR
jgi:hypothetical protein